MAALKSLLDNPNICGISVLATLCCLSIQIDIFLVLHVPCNLDCMLDILNIMLGVSGSCLTPLENVDILDQQALDLVYFRLQVLTRLMGVVIPMSLPL